MTGDHLVLELVRSETAWLGQALRGMLLRRLPLDGTASVVAQVDVTGHTLPDRVFPLLGRAFSELQLQYGEALRGVPLDVQLGLDHARIGLVDLSGVSRDAQTTGNCDTYAHAWVAQMLHLDASAALIRWQLLDQSRKLLVSCVARQIVATLTDFCVQYGLRFSSCRPAVLAALDRLHARDARPDPLLVRDVAWTEAAADGGRSGKVQLLRLQGRQLSALWRGWVPPSEARGSKDISLDEAIGRFQRVNSPGSLAAVECVVWPIAAVAATTG